jgi:hypothetical protein
VTWSASELPRPGAVWAHALVVGAAELAEPGTLEVLLGLPRRPSRDVAYLGSYRTPISLDGASPSAPSYLPAEPLDREVLARLAFAAYDPHGEGTVAHEDLGGAAKALLALWRAQWPALRAAFSFRTREVVRPGTRDFDLTVTRKIRGQGGESPPGAAGTEPWLQGLVEDAAAGAPTPLGDWLAAFGPLEAADPRRLAALAKLWPLGVAGAWRPTGRIRTLAPHSRASCSRSRTTTGGRPSQRASRPRQPQGHQPGWPELRDRLSFAGVAWEPERAA